ncbi:MAG: glucose-6-phosphate isomerase, partial [Bryobacteraceae bacterium]
MQIRFDETNLLAEMVGETHGVPRALLKAERGRALAALAAFRKRSEKGEYGFPHLPFQQKAIDEVREYARAQRGAFDTVCLVGIGGSALGAWALDCGLRGPHPVQPAFSSKNPRLVVLDNVDPHFVGAALDSMSPKKTLVVVVAKSGETPETVATFLMVENWMRRVLGKKARRRIAVVTTSGKGDLATLAARNKYQTFAIPENVGGRFSVLSPVGLLPAALIGADIRKLCKGAAAMTQDSWRSDLRQNIALRAALCHYLLLTSAKKPIHVAFPYS